VSTRAQTDPRTTEQGYVLFGIAIGLVILGISMTAAVPLWEKVVQREREEELIFRGYQYMQAIQLYQTRFPGAYPPTIDMLVEQKFLRRAYKDPFATSEEGEFRVIRQMSPELQQASEQQRRAAGEAAGITDLNRSRSRTSTPGGSTSARGSGRGFQSTLGRTALGDAGASMGGIVGVASIGDQPTFVQVPGKPNYRDWLFVYGTQQPTAAPVLPGTGLPGAGAPASPFPGLPPPPGLTSFRFSPNAAGAAGQFPGGGAPGGRPAPGGAGATPPPQQRGTSPGGAQGPNLRPPGTPLPNQPPR